MRSVSHAVDMIAAVTDLTRTQVDQRASQLKDYGLLPKSRGKAVELMTDEQLFLLLATVAFANTRPEAPTVAEAFAALPFEGAPEDGGQTPARLFADALDPVGVWDCCQMEFGSTRNGYSFTFTGTLRGPLESEVELSTPFYKHRSWGGHTRRAFTLSADGFEMLRFMWNRDPAEHVEVLHARNVEAS